MSPAVHVNSETPRPAGPAGWKTGAGARALAHQLGRSALVAAATAGAVLLFLWIILVALVGPGELLAPVGFGLFGPPLAYCLLRPTIVMSVSAGAVIGIVFFLEHLSPSAAVHGGQQLDAGSAD